MPGTLTPYDSNVRWGDRLRPRRVIEGGDFGPHIGVADGRLRGWCGGGVRWSAGAVGRGWRFSDCSLSGTLGALRGFWGCWGWCEWAETCHFAWLNRSISGGDGSSACRGSWGVSCSSGPYSAARTAVISASVLGGVVRRVLDAAGTRAGHGGAVPFAAEFATAFPDAAITVTAIPATTIPDAHDPRRRLPRAHLGGDRGRAGASRRAAGAPPTSATGLDSARKPEARSSGQMSRNPGRDCVRRPTALSCGPPPRNRLGEGPSETTSHAKAGAER